MVDKKALKDAWKTSQQKEYILTNDEANDLLDYLEEIEECDHTLKHTKAWLAENIEEDKIEAVLQELEEMGGYCDCEVAMNCYEDYM